MLDECFRSKNTQPPTLLRIRLLVLIISENGRCETVLKRRRVQSNLRLSFDTPELPGEHKHYCSGDDAEQRRE